MKALLIIKIMIGAIIGDIVGSKFDNVKITRFPLFSKESSYTDDSIMTVAVADWLLHGGELVKIMQRLEGNTLVLWEDMEDVLAHG